MSCFVTKDITSFTQDLIKIPSITPKAEKALDYLQSFLEDLGFTCHRLPFGKAEAKVDNLFAFIGQGHPHFGYAGHVDVVPYGPLEEWQFDPLSAKIHNDNIYGRGAADMKGSVAAFCIAVQNYLKQKSSSLKGKISLLITADEEGPAINGTKPVIEWMAQNGHQPDICLIGEPTCRENFGDTVKIGRRGSLTGHLKIIGKQGHIAYPHLAKNPVPALSKVITALTDHQFDTGDAHFDPSNLEIIVLNTSTQTTNVIPGFAECKFNIRYNTQQNTDDLITLTSKIIKGNCNLPYELEFNESGKAFLSSIDDKTLSEIQSIIKTQTNHTPKPMTNGGTSDARFIHAYCPVIEFGPMGNTIHQIDEHISISDLEKLVIIYEEIMALFLS